MANPPIKKKEVFGKGIFVQVHHHLAQIPLPYCQLMGSEGPVAPGLRSSMAVVGGQRLVRSQSGLIVPSGSGESVKRRRVPASEEHAEEHRSSVEKVRLPSLANELERFRQEGTVSPAKRILASISCARWRTRPGFPRMLRMLSLLELRVSVEPCGNETGVSAPMSSTAGGTDVQKSAGVSVDADGRSGVSAASRVAVPVCSRKRS